MKKKIFKEKKWKRLFESIDQAHKMFITEKIEFELKEIENVFSLLIFGAFTGLPSPPSFITLELLPYMEKEITIMINSSHDAKDILSTLAGTFDGM